VEEAWQIRITSYATIHRSCKLIESHDQKRYILKQIRLKHIANAAAEGAGQVDAYAPMEDKLRTIVETCKHADLPPIAVPLPLKQAENRFILRWERWGYHLTEFVDGRRPSVRRLGDAVSICDSLGRLHRAGLGLASGFQRATRDLVTTLADDLSSFKKLDERLENLPRGLRKWLMRRRRGQIQELLSMAAEVAGWERSGREQLTICHGDTHENNYLLVPTKECCILDVESFCCSSAAIDLSVPLIYHSYYAKYSPKNLAQILACYESRNTLKECERIFLWVQLILPHAWRQACVRYLKRPTFNPTSISKLFRAYHGTSAHIRLAKQIIANRGI